MQSSSTAPSISTPEIAVTPPSIATQFCMGSISSWSCSCGDLSSEYIQIKTGDSAKACEVTLPHAYRLHLSDDWYCNVAGAAAINLSCITVHGERIFIRSVRSELALAKANQAVDRFCEGEGCISDPVVDPDEEILEKELMKIGDKPVLRFLSKQDDLFILRYFVRNSDRVYVLRVESNDLLRTKASTSLLEEIINSMEFLP